MIYSIVQTTAEDILFVIDAVYAKPENCNSKFICDFTDLSESQVKNALHMAQEFSLVTFDSNTSTYKGNSSLARLMLSTRTEEQKAAIMWLILDQYEPYRVFKDRLMRNDTLDQAAKKVKAIFDMKLSSSEIKETITNIATYSKAIINNGARNYKLNQDETSHIDILERVLYNKANDNNILLSLLGERIYDDLNKETIIVPLLDAFSKIQATPTDGKSIILYAANAFESFLVQLGSERNISLIGKNGIIAKSNMLSFSKKHKGMIEYLGHVRNASDHGADPSENNTSWAVYDETAKIYPFVVVNLIKAIKEYENTTLYV